MLFADKLHEGMFIELEVMEGAYQGKYRTKIEEIGNRIISIGVPLVEGQFIPLHEGTSLRVIFTDDIAAYSFSSRIVKRITEPIPTFYIEYPQKIKKIQRRQYVRVPVVQELSYRIVEEEELSEEKKGFMKDLSGGGLLMAASEDLPPQTKIKIKTIIGATEMELPGITLRSTKDNDSTYLISVKFTDISERTRDRIIKYIFDIQREMRRKGLV